MTVNESELKDAEGLLNAPEVPRRIENAQTVCRTKNEKGKLCNGHLKQVRTGGEPAEVHLRGDDVLFKCQTCGALYMGPPLGHIRDPQKQHRFVEAELSALLQAAGGTLPVVKKDARGVFVLADSGEHGHAAAPATPKPEAPAAKPAATQAATPQVAPKPTSPATSAPAHKPGAEPNRELFRRSTYAGVKDTGPAPGETFEQKVARLKALSAAAKQRAEESGTEVAPPAEAPATKIVEQPVEEPVTSTAPVQAAPQSTPVASAHKPTGQADRTLFRRSTYCGVVDTGPVPGETFEQKIQRLAKLSAAAKQRAEGG